MFPYLSTLTSKSCTNLAAMIAFALADCLGQSHAESAEVACESKSSGLSLPKGFCATVYADAIGHARHMAMRSDGTLYVNTWSGPYYGSEPPRPGGFLVALRDVDDDGVADDIRHFGPGVAEGSTGGTGIAIYKEWLYAEAGDRIVRWPLISGVPVPTGNPEVIVTGLPMDGEHPMHQFVIDGAGNLFVNVGSATNACEIQMDVPKPRAPDPCVELETRAGVWRFSATEKSQKFSPALRYATGMRNAGGMRVDHRGRVLLTQHGRDSLAQNWSNLFSAEDGAELPAEELLELKKDADYGWPYCYFDGNKRRLVLAPEYGGDGAVIGRCSRAELPVAYFPAHWAPNDLLFYRGSQFPAAYREGAFVAFHGSWNRAPRPQAGFKVVFQPMTAGRASGTATTFADGFAGKTPPDASRYRPAGLAESREGSLFVSDDRFGRIWRIIYHGPPQAIVESAPPPVYSTPTETQDETLALPVPSSRTAEDVKRGARIFSGEQSGGTCSGCHGTNGKGGGMAPSLTSGTWLWSDGGLAGIETTIRSGVTKPKKALGGMPPLGGAQLSEEDVEALASYVWAIGHQRNP